MVKTVVFRTFFFSCWCVLANTYSATRNQTLVDHFMDCVKVVPGELTGSAQNSQENNEVIKHFVNLLKTIEANQVGRFLLSFIINNITSKGANNDKYALCVTEIREPAQLSSMNFQPPLSTSDHPIIQFTTLNPSLTTINVSDGKATTLTPTEPDICLFHELLHWAHYLKNSAEMLDLMPIPGSGYMDKCAKSTFFTHEIFRDYPKLLELKMGQVAEDPISSLYIDQWVYKNSEGRIIEAPFAHMNRFLSTDLLTNGVQQRLSAQRWIPVVKVEEVRTILGSGDTSQEPIYRISENAYRWAKAIQDDGKEPVLLRFGHNCTTCSLDEFTIKWLVCRAIDGCKAAGIDEDAMTSLRQRLGL